MSDLALVPPDPTLWRVMAGRHAGKIVDQAEIDRLLGLKTGPFLRYQRCRIHECNGCGRRDAWRDSWGWYGSINDLDEERPIIRWCSDECRERLQADGRIPARMRKLD